MTSAGLQGLTRRKGLRRAKPDTVAFSDDRMARSFRPDRHDVLWVADITQHPTREGWVSCAVVIDADSRLVVGHAIADQLRTDLVIDAFDVANWRRLPAPGTMLHSDHGPQYVAWSFGRRLREGRIARVDGERRRRARQRRRRIVLRIDADRAPRPGPDLGQPDPARQRDVRIDRGVLRPSAPPLDARLQDPCRLRQDPPDRTRGRGLTTKPRLSTQRGELQHDDILPVGDPPTLETSTKVWADPPT